LFYPYDERWPISQRFGERPHVYTTSKGHNGIDFAIPVGNPIYCAWDGVVEVARADTAGYGRHIRIRHSHGLTIYGHMSRNDVKVGDKVSEGQTVLIIEAMKTMNQIPAPRGGTIRRILVEDATPVEYGAPLMIIE
jgi:murein DD-endopeptidase MepM/ murein hydrolase activator NlpD